MNDQINDVFKIQALYQTDQLEFHYFPLLHSGVREGVFCNVLQFEEGL